jgi:predicted MPP superfamily phosphohydrolase
MKPFSYHGFKTATVVVLLVFAVGWYGFYEAKKIRVERVQITTQKLGAGKKRLRVAQISDVHLGLINREAALGSIISKLKPLNPDVVVATGDLVDSGILHHKKLIELWKEIKPPVGKFAVTGNHEVYAGLHQSIEYMERCDFMVLRNSGQNVQGIFTIVGVDDDHVSHDGSNETALLKAHQNGNFILFLKHRPTVNKKAARLFDLQLSGHAHRGQIFPFNFFTYLAYPMQDGLYDLQGGGKLYTSRGTGTWGPPMRVLSPPEITLIDIFDDRGQSSSTNGGLTVED